MLKLGLLGLGHMSRFVLDIWRKAPEPKPQIIVVQEVPDALEHARAFLGDDIAVVDNIDDHLNMNPDVGVECATQQALRACAPQILRRGKDLLIISNGALANEAFLNELRQAALDGQSTLFIPSGAIGAIDVLSAARLAKLSEVRQSLAKPPRSWKNTPAEKEFDLDKLTERTCIFAGTARAASTLYPQNANVTATVALAGLGFDQSYVQLFADPSLNGPVHTIEAKGDFGTFYFELHGVSLPDNPKTSLLAGLSLAKSLLNLDSWIRL